MAYRKYRSLGELLNSELGPTVCAKLIRNLVSLDYEEKPCNCSPSSRINNICPYHGKIRTSCIVYKATCKETGKSYIGNTQQAYKKRMAGHLSDVQRLVLKVKNLTLLLHTLQLFSTPNLNPPRVYWYSEEKLRSQFYGNVIHSQYRNPLALKIADYV